MVSEASLLYCLLDCRLLTCYIASFWSANYLQPFTQCGMISLHDSRTSLVAKFSYIILPDTVSMANVLKDIQQLLNHSFQALGEQWLLRFAPLERLGIFSIIILMHRYFYHNVVVVSDMSSLVLGHDTSLDISLTNIQNFFKRMFKYIYTTYFFILV